MSKHGASEPRARAYEAAAAAIIAEFERADEIDSWIEPRDRRDAYRLARAAVCAYRASREESRKPVRRLTPAEALLDPIVSCGYVVPADAYYRLMEECDDAYDDWREHVESLTGRPNGAG